MGVSFTFAAALAAAAFQSAVSDQPGPLEPSGPWTVEHADSMCIVGRKFGTGEQEVTLGFRPGPMSEHMRVAVWLSDKSEKFKFGVGRVAIDSFPPVAAPYGRGPTPIKGLQLIKIDTKRPEIGNLDTAKILHVSVDDLNLSFRLGNIRGAITALQKCERELLIGWGMDPTVLDSITTQPFHRNIVSLFSTNDYPSSAISKGEQGTAGVHFRIGTDGKVSDCRVVETSGSAALDAQTCKIIVRRARYEPARTKAGEPVASIGFQRIRWEMGY